MKRDYEAPKVITYSEDEIIELLGPAKPVHQARVQRTSKGLR
jgi:hypothetical protein